MSFSGTKGYLTKPKPGVMLNPLHPLSRGLVGYWLFNEGSGSQAYDISGKGNHGILNSMSPNTQGSGWGGSKFGGGMEFDGVNDYIRMADGDSLNINGAASWECWFKANSLTSYDRIIHKGSTGNYGYTLGLDSNLRLAAAYAINDTTHYKADVFTISTDMWYHALGVYDGASTTKLYVNGILATETMVGQFNDENDNLYIGRRAGSSANYFKGSIDLVRIYNRALSPLEVKILYEQPFCNLLQVPLRRYFMAAPPVGAIMNQFQKANIGADLYNGVFA